MPIQYNSSTSTYVSTTVFKPATSGSNYTLQFPATAGTSNQTLTFDTNGLASFTTVSAVTITGFTTAYNSTTYVGSMTASGGSVSQAVALVTAGSGGLLCSIPDDTYLGGNVRGSYSIDFQSIRTAASQVASGSYAIMLAGQNNTASGTSSIILAGQSNTVSSTANYIIAGSSNTISSNSYSTILSGIGNQSEGTSPNLLSIGSVIVNGLYGSMRGQGFVTVFGSNNFGATTSPYGRTQAVNHRFTVATTDATPKMMTTDCSFSTYLTTYSENNTITVPASFAYVFTAIVVATVTGAGNTKSWVIEGLVRRPTSGNITFVGTPTVTSPYGDAGAAGWSVSVNVDTTNQMMYLQVTGQAATTIRWAASVWTVEAY